MKIKRYLDKDMRHVLRRVREDQGPDAVILSNRRVEEGIEVIAAIDYDEALVRHAMGTKADSKTADDKRIESDVLATLAEDDFVPEPEPAAEVIKADVQPRPLDVQAQPLREMQDELSSLRGLLETQLSGLIWKDSADRSPMRAQMLRNLARLGIAPDVATTVIDRIEPVGDVKSLWHAPLTSLAKMLPVKRSTVLESGGTFALIGPTGVGKTTTIAKIAAQFAMTHGADEIALVSADSFRIGAKEHLMAFANIIGAKVYSASTSAELTDLLVRLRQKKLVLIDTEGRSPRDRDLAHRLAAYGNNEERVKFFLTLSAATQESALDEAVRQFRQVPLEGCIVTKVDEAGQLGCVISAMIRHDLPVCWLSDGQQIPDDLHNAVHKRMWLINQAIECLEHAEPRLDEKTMAQIYAQASVGHA
ncbi:MAG: flagellar biosynthesis protein FlhF [Woeseiaceae bacterium]|nr:flagellar biosynthesis protein FlhF [Woeseiaceae bacterium]